MRALFNLFCLILLALFFYSLSFVMQDPTELNIKEKITSFNLFYEHVNQSNFKCGSAFVQKDVEVIQCYFERKSLPGYNVQLIKRNNDVFFVEKGIETRVSNSQSLKNIRHSLELAMKFCNEY